MTVSQWRVSARKRRIWRRQRASCRSSQREGVFTDPVVPLVVVVVVVVFVLVAGLELSPLLLDAVAAAAAVAMPANASRSPQARMKRRNA
jgi:hypothetical protein